MVEFRILGPLEVLAEGRPLALGGHKQRALLALLLLEANRVVSNQRLIDALWEDEPPETVQKALQVYVSQLRKVLGRDRLQTRPPGYLLCVEDGELDVQRFQQLLACGEHHEALALWRGPMLPEFVYRRFAQPEIARLAELRLAALEERIEADLQAGRHAELVGELDALVSEHPRRQRLRRQLMSALYRSGRDAEALEIYQQARRTLVEELGIEPGRELRELQQAILRQDPALDLVVDDAPSTDPSREAFVGREREVDELVGGLDDAFAGQGRLFLLAGEPGIGKSRLAEELASRARARGAQVLIGRCWEAGGAPAYWPWVQSLRAYVGDTEAQTLRAQLGSGAAELAQLLPELRERFADIPEPPALESESARFRLFEAASAFLTNAAQARPLVLVLDDLHAADEPSLLLLRFLARQLGASRLLVVGAYRDVDPSLSDALTTALTELVREPVTRSLALTGLSDRDVAHFIEFTTGEAPNDELVALIHEETEGNPLFVVEIVRLLATEGSLENTAARSRLTIPQSVRDVIARRLRHLSEECNRLLVLACVLGREFSLAALARLGGVSENELLDTLDEAMIAGVVSDLPGAPGRLRFAHVLIRDTLYEELTAARRVRLHRLAVEALEDLYGDEPGSHLAELVQQSVAGNDFERGLRYTRRAGDRALGLLAYEEAARLYELALETLSLLDPDDEATRCELLLSLGEGHARAGNMPTAKRTFLVAADIARRLGRSANLAHAAAGYGGRLAWPRAGEDDRLVPLLEEGLAALGDENVELRARLLGRLAGALRDEHSPDRRDRLSREAVELARQSGNPTALAYALDGRGAAIFGPDTGAECLALGRELCELAARSGDREQAVAGHWLRILPQVLFGDLREAEVDLAAAARTADELRQPVQLWQLEATRAILALAAGRLDEAEELIPKALALGEGDPRDAVAAYLFQRYTLNCFRGGVEELKAKIRDSVDEYPNRPVFRCLLAHLQVRLGREQQAKRAFAELAADGFSALPFDQEWLYGMSLLAETCSLLNDPESAAVMHALLRPYAALNAFDPPEGIRGSVSRYLGLLATTIERWSDAERHFEDALAMNDRMGARPWLAYTQHDYARMLSARDLPGDRDRAHELLRTARITYRALGMDTDGSNVEIVNDNRA